MKPQRRDEAFTSTTDIMNHSVHILLNDSRKYLWQIGDHNRRLYLDDFQSWATGCYPKAMDADSGFDHWQILIPIPT